MDKKGFSFIEMMVVFVLFGIIASFGIPRLRSALYKSNVRAARLAIGTVISKARAYAIQRGCTVTVNLTTGATGTVSFTACSVTGSGTQTLNASDSVAARYKVSLSPSSTGFKFDPRGLKGGTETITIGIVATGNSTISDSVIVDPVGKVTRQ